MLLLAGKGKQPSDWHVLETKPPLYTRAYLILGGKTVYHAGGAARPLLPGWLYIFPAHIPYELTTDPEDPIECMHMHLDLRGANLSRLIAIDLSADRQIANLMRVIEDGVDAACPPGYMEQLALAFEELCLARGFFETMDACTGQYIDALREVYRTDANLESIAAQFGYSPEHFIRIFKKRVGVSPHQYIVSLRMSDAVRMLAATSSLDEIAAAVGYADGRSFSNAFRRYYGVSPSLYREHYAGHV